MGAAGALMAVQTGAGLVGSFMQSGALREQGRAEERIAEQNARLLELQAEDALYRGNTEANQQRRKGRYVKGAQRAGFAGQGVAVDTGTAAAIGAETDAMSELDALTIKNNAFREAWGYRNEAINQRFEGRQRRIAAKNKARYTLLTGGIQAADDISRGLYRSSGDRNSSFTPRNPTEARFDREYRRSQPRIRRYRTEF